MAKQLTPLGRFLLIFCGLGLAGYALYRYGAFGKMSELVGPKKKAEGTVSGDDFGPGSTPGSPGSATSTRPLSGGSRLGRPLRVAIVLWGGYAGGIMANGGMS